YDLVCVGFGPASLAIAIALHEKFPTDGFQPPFRVLFLERQRCFAWHSGMLLPETHMQISFMKDLATLRNPRSEFTFVNYLHTKGRLVAFTNLGTFLPLREEYNDYMSWCAEKFNHLVQYSQNVVSVEPVFNKAGSTTAWKVNSKHTENGSHSSFTTCNVVIAVGGRSSIPDQIRSQVNNDPRIIHSSQYATSLRRILPSRSDPYNIAVVGSGQSAAEIFNDLHSTYPNSTTSLFIRSHALKPSDDSPFVNEIFNPERVDEFYGLHDDVRRKALKENKGTNYSVVREDLLDKLYQRMYVQRLRDGNDESNWKHRIFPLREVMGAEIDKSNGKVNLMLWDTRNENNVEAERKGFDAVIFGTGYVRDVHESLLNGLRPMMKDGTCTVGRDYKMLTDSGDGKILSDMGIYLQGCCEDTHGLSDTLLSILAVRGGELVDSIFG
ncbi:L-ornithine N5-oxygenase sida, partial [Ascodesmis nigricans]